MHIKQYTVVFSIILFTVISAMNIEESRDTDKIPASIMKLYISEVKSLTECLETYTRHFYNSNFEVRKHKFEELVYKIKKIEGLFIYLNPEAAYETLFLTPKFQKRDFGPPFPDNWLIIGPFGIEPDTTVEKWKKDDLTFSGRFIARAINNFKSLMLERLKVNDKSLPDESDIFEAMQLQMARISTIGLSNGDFVITEAGLPSLKGEFASWAEMMRIIISALPEKNKELKESISVKLIGGESFLSNNYDFNSLNRLEFLTEFLIPLSEYLQMSRKVLKIRVKNKVSAYKLSASHIYDMNAFNADFFAPGAEAYLSKAKAELGKFLFFDPILSGNNERACASCHKPDMAFTDGNTRSMNFDRGDLSRNAPTVINAGFQSSQFWDLRASSLEDQLDSVINNKEEMHSSFGDVAGRLSESAEYVKLFNAAFPETRKDGIQRKHIKIAIASYERELTGLNSRFDKYVRGDKTQLTSSEKNGFNVYMGKAKCGSCHYAPLFNGALPPYFTFTDHRAIGVPLKDSMKIYEVDIDTGASKVFKDPFMHFSFKVPTVRNAELTAPYMHNGVFRTLEQVVDFYNDAAGIKFMNDMRPGMKGLPFFMILPEKLDLTPEEKKDLVAFMKSLTDTSSAGNKPDRLPEIKGKYSSLNKRVLGGVY